MARPPEPRRQILESLLISMKSRNAWPRPADVERWVSKRLRGKRHGEIAKATEGKPVPSSVLQALFAFLVSGPAERHERQVFRECLIERLGIPPGGPMPATEQLVVRLSQEVSVQLTPSSPPRWHDVRPRGPSAILSLVFRSRGVLDRLAQNCGPGSATVNDAVNWMCVDVGRECYGRHLSIVDAKAAAERRMLTSADKYAAVAAEWHAWNPWTVTLTRGSKDPVGMSIVLPLKPESYDRIAGGSTIGHQLTRHDLQVPSDHLLIEASSTRSFDLAGPEKPATVTLMAVMLAQAGTLANPIRSYTTARPLRMLSFCGTPLVRKRLEGYGFKSLGTFMTSTNIPLMEKRLDPTLARPKDAVFCTLIAHLANIHGNPPLP